MLIWSIFLTGVVALLFFMMYPRTDYIQTVETPIAQTAIVQFTTQHKNALNLALKAVKTAADRTDKTYMGSGDNRDNNLTIYYPDFATLDKTKYLPDGLEQLDWDTKPESRIVCINYDTGATANLSTMGNCSIGGYDSTNQETLDYGTRDYLITYAPKPAYFDTDFPGWGSAWAEETKDMDTCGIVKDGKIQSPKCPGGLCDLSASENTTRLQNLITASGLLKNDKLEDNAVICISPIDHYAYDGVSITGKNPNMLVYYDGINNTWTGHNDTTTWYDLSGNGNNDTINTSKATIEENRINFLGSGLPFTTPITGLYPKLTIQTPMALNFEVNNSYTKAGASVWGSRDTSATFASTSPGMELSLLSTSKGATFYEGNGSAINSKKLSFDEQDHTIAHTLTFRRNSSKYALLRNNSLLAESNGFTPLSTTTTPKFSFMHRSYGRQAAYLYALRFYTVPLTKTQINLNYQLDRKRFNIPKVTDNNGNDYTYLQNDGVAYIKTGFVPTGGSKAYIKAKIMKVDSSTPQDYGGTAYGANHNSYFFPLSTTTDGAFVYGFGYYHIVYAHTVAVNNIVESTLTVNAAGTSANVEYNNLTKGTSYTTTQSSENGGTLNTPYDIYLFAGHNASTQTYTENATAKIARYTIWQDGELQHDFIPAEDPFGRPAMYDKISGKFFYNAASSGEFTLTTD